MTSRSPRSHTQPAPTSCKLHRGVCLVPLCRADARAVGCNLDVVPCANRGTCNWQSGTCACTLVEGYYGPGCLLCEPGYYLSQGLCHKCSSDTKWAAIGVAGVALLVAIVFVQLNKSQVVQMM